MKRYRLEMYRFNATIPVAEALWESDDAELLREFARGHRKLFLTQRQYVKLVDTETGQVETSFLDPGHIRWQKNVLDALVIGGRYGIPLTGAVFEKLGKDLILVECRGMDEDLLLLAIEHMEAGGYRVVYEKPPPVDPAVN